MKDTAIWKGSLSTPGAWGLIPINQWLLTTEPSWDDPPSCRDPGPPSLPKLISQSPLASCPRSLTEAPFDLEFFDTKNSGIQSSLPWDVQDGPLVN